MADKCAGCTNKYGFFERPSICPECRKGFCQRCLPYQGKKVKKELPQIALEPCVYCSKQKSVNEQEEADILSNFQERFYKHAHTEPPIQSTLRLDKVMGRGNTDPHSTTTTTTAVQLSEEDKVLEERLKKLKEPAKKIPTYSQGELQEKLERLRGDGANQREGGGTSSNTCSEDKDSGSGKTQAEETDNLMEKTADEVMLDDRLRESEDQALMKKFHAFQGGSGGGGEGSSRENSSEKQARLDVQNLLENMDDEMMLEEESPEKLLSDLLALQAKKTKDVQEEVGSTDVQFLLEKAQEMAKQNAAANVSGNPLPEIVYPEMPAVSVGQGEKMDPAHKAEVSKVMQRGMQELKQEEQEDKFIEQTSERLKKLRAEVNPDEVVKSKPDEVVKSKPDEVIKSKPVPKVTFDPQLDFSWSHFDTDPSMSDENNFSDEVQDLIARTLEEAELDQRLEASGLKINIQTVDSPSRGRGGRGQDRQGLSGAREAEVGGACGTDELPWCCICNDDASLRCYDCDDDLYCQRCFTEGHNQFALHDHKYEIYRPSGKK